MAVLRNFEKDSPLVVPLPTWRRRIIRRLKRLAGVWDLLAASDSRRKAESHRLTANGSRILRSVIRDVGILA